ncbi:ABC transporter permease subunit, partial [[Mycoplasma] falconis]|uniref:ABC transporter permease subunit n=1 Tax=[Mycoplasma] falconis TaxID=92403 RepID=UPI001476BB68
ISFLFLLEIINLGFNKLFFSNKQQKVNFKKYELKRSFKKIFLLIIFILFVVLIIISIWTISSSSSFYKEQSKDYLNQLFNPNWKNVKWNFTIDGFFYMVIQLGFLVFLTMLLTNFLVKIKLFFMTKQLFGYKFSLITRLYNSLIRTIPIISYFLIISNLFYSSAAAFVLAFAIHSSATLSRNVESSIRKIDQSKINNLLKNNFSKLWIFRNYIMPTIKLDYITFLSLETEKIIRNFITYGLYNASAIGIASKLNRANNIEDIAPYLWISFFILCFVALISYLVRLKLNGKFKNIFKTGFTFKKA